MNEQAEEILIGTILKDNSILEEVTLSPEHFLNISNRKIFEAMLNIKRKGFPIDGASLKDEMGESGFFFIGGHETLQDYKNTVASIHAFRSYEKMIINTWKVNTAKDLLRETLETDLTVDAVQNLIKELSRVDEEGTLDDFNLQSVLQNLYEETMTEPPKKRSGIPSGYKDIDDKTDGFQRSDLIIVGARPSMGKTAFVLNLAINAAIKAKAIPVIFSLEMTTEKMMKRMEACIAEVNGMKLKNTYHYTNDAEKERLIKAIGVLGEIKPYIYDRPGQRVAEMRAKVRKIKQAHPDREVIIFIDYLTKIKATNEYKGNDHQKVTEISGDLKAMAKDFDIPVVCLAQLNRGVEQRQDRRPLNSDLRESGSIEQDADIIMFLYRDDYYEKDEKKHNRILEVDISKNRDGEVGRVQLKYTKEFSKIETLPRHQWVTT